MTQRSPRLPKKYDALMVNILYISDMFLPIRYGISFDFNRRLCFLFFRFRDEKLTRSNVRNIQDSNVNVDKVKA